MRRGPAEARVGSGCKLLHLHLLFSRGCEAMPSPPPPSVQGSGPSHPAPPLQLKLNSHVCPLPPPRPPPIQVTRVPRTRTLAHRTFPNSLSACLYAQQVLAAHISDRLSWSDSRRFQKALSSDESHLALPVVVVAPRSFSPLFIPPHRDSGERGVTERGWGGHKIYILLAVGVPHTLDTPASLRGRSKGFLKTFLKLG